MSLISDIKDHIEELKKTEQLDMGKRLEEKLNAVLNFQLDCKLSKLNFAESNPYESDIHHALHLYIGSITIVNRRTGFSGGVRDTETGFRDPYNKFWLASGNFDIREQGDITVREAIKLIKENANTCRGN